VTYTSTSGEIDITWDPPLERNGLVTSYTIDLFYSEKVCRKAGEARHETKNTVVPLTQLTLNHRFNLLDYWDYNITITATNVIGSGNATDIIAFKTKPGGRCYDTIIYVIIFTKTTRSN